jgi:hypothetical protein
VPDTRHSAPGGHAATVDCKGSAQVLEAISPLTGDARLKAAPSDEETPRATITALHLQLQQVAYAAMRAFEQDDQVDPKHRLVASQLESRGDAQ